MADYIEREALKKRMFSYFDCVNEHSTKWNYCGDTLMAYEVADMIEDCIDNAPAADVAPVVHGRWYLNENSYWACKEEFLDEYGSFENGIVKYCPNCGAKMNMKDGDELD